MARAKKHHDPIMMAYLAEIITHVNHIDRVVRAARRGDYLEEDRVAK